MGCAWEFPLQQAGQEGCPQSLQAEMCLPAASLRFSRLAPGGLRLLESQSSHFLGKFDYLKPSFTPIETQYKNQNKTIEALCLDASVSIFYVIQMKLKNIEGA